MYEEIVGRGGVSPAYFFDSMDFYEAARYLEGMRRKEKFELEKTRLIMWSVFQSQCRKDIALEDVFVIDDEKKVEKPDEEELEELRKRAKKMEKKL